MVSKLILKAGVGLLTAFIAFPIAAVGEPVPETCSHYDAAADGVHVSCLEFGGQQYWVDFRRDPSAAERFVVRGYGTDVALTAECASVDPLSSGLLLRCFEYAGNPFWVYLEPQPANPTSFGGTTLGGRPAGEDYNIGNPVLTDLWVDPVNGDNSRSGLSRSTALRTLDEAWNRIPQGTVLSGTGYRIMLTSGDYAADGIPVWMASRYGTYRFPVIIQAADGQHTARLHGYLNLNDVRYLYLIDLDFVTDPGYGGGGNVIHVAEADHLLIRRCSLNGFDGSVRQPQETLKINQSRYVFVEESDIAGAFWFSLDFVAVEYGHIRKSHIHDAAEDCLVLKGGTAYFTVDGNVIDHCNSVGFSAGEGTGFEFMRAPWLHYEILDTKFTNNLLHDVANAGIAVRGGFNILAAYNTLYRISYDTRGSGLVLLSPGGRSCDGNTAGCSQRHAAGGWGPAYVGDGGEWIPNRNVLIHNNIFLNPQGVTSESHFVIFGPVAAPSGTNIPSPVLSDENLRIQGNIIWNGAGGIPLGAGGPDGGCADSNPACNQAQLLADNAVNTVEPVLVDPGNGDFHPAASWSMADFPIPGFSGSDRPSSPLAPKGDLFNGITRDRDGCSRSSSGRPGAYTASSAACGPGQNRTEGKWEILHNRLPGYIGKKNDGTSKFQ